MCWSKRSSQDNIPTMTTNATTSGFVNGTTITPPEFVCGSHGVECSGNQYDRYCSDHGQCCMFENDHDSLYCVCFAGYTDHHCQTPVREGNTTIGLAAGVGCFIFLLVIAVVVFVVYKYLKKHRESGSNGASNTNTQTPSTKKHPAAELLQKQNNNGSPEAEEHQLMNQGNSNV